jgi:hypothetical protein
METPMHNPSAAPGAPAAESAAPWWRFGIVWLAFGGPAAVVLASAATFAIAARHADTVVDTATAVTRPAEGGGAERLGALPTAPALQGRNHAATPRP